MSLRRPTLDSRLASLDDDLAALRPDLSCGVAAAVDRWRADAAALRFHLRDRRDHPPLVAILGGTGTGKSTILNRLLQANLSATSFRRTYTAGAVAIVRKPDDLPHDWLGIDHRPAADDELPARGLPDALVVVTCAAPLADRATLIDTPDLDGDQPQHHLQADRAFRWAGAVLFLVTPEKYQMTELLPYYRLARRYGATALFAMNKCEETAVLDDYARLLAARDWADAEIFAIPRDDAAWSPPPDRDLTALRAALDALPARLTGGAGDKGLAARTADLLGRLGDQVIAPLQDARREADKLTAVLRAMESPEPGVDVNPITQQLQRRLQQRSVLYLMGPGRMMERVRQVPGLIVRLPRTLWDAVIRGKRVTLNEPDVEAAEAKVPDFRANLIDQFAVVQSRIDDALRSSPIAERWLAERAASYKSAQLDAAEAGKIADEELAELRDWLEKRWNATPRDTLLILRLLQHLPGGKRLVQWAEATPYLLALIVATHGAFFGHLDLMIIGGFTLATWLTEKLSNEVTNRVRATNRRIGERFAQLAHQQIQQIAEWLERQAVPARAIERLLRAGEQLGEQLGDVDESMAR